jgi:hypothetical protein
MDDTIRKDSPLQESSGNVGSATPPEASVPNSQPSVLAGAEVQKSN